MTNLSRVDWNQLFDSIFFIKEKKSWRTLKELLISDLNFSLVVAAFLHNMAIYFSLFVSNLS